MFMNEVKWLKFPVGFTTSPVFMAMHHEKKGSHTNRDKLGCVWLELFDLAGRLDQNGCLLQYDTPLTVGDIASSLSRQTKGVWYCLDWYMSHGLMTVDPLSGAYQIVGWKETQSTERMKKLRNKGEGAGEASGEKSSSADKAQSIAHTEEKRKENNKIDWNKKEEMKKEETSADDFEARRADALAKLRKRGEEEAARRALDPEKAAQYDRLKAEAYEKIRMR